MRVWAEAPSVLAACDLDSSLLPSELPSMIGLTTCVVRESCQTHKQEDPSHCYQNHVRHIQEDQSHCYQNHVRHKQEDRSHCYQNHVRYKQKDQSQNRVTSR